MSVSDTVTRKIMKAGKVLSGSECLNEEREMILLVQHDDDNYFVIASEDYSFIDTLHDHDPEGCKKDIVSAYVSGTHLFPIFPGDTVLFYKDEDEAFLLGSVEMQSDDPRNI